MYTEQLKHRYYWDLEMESPEDEDASWGVMDQNDFSDVEDFIIDQCNDGNFELEECQKEIRETGILSLLDEIHKIIRIDLETKEISYFYQPDLDKEKIKSKIMNIEPAEE